MSKTRSPTCSGVNISPSVTFYSPNFIFSFIAVMRSHDLKIVFTDTLTKAVENTIYKHRLAIAHLHQYFLNPFSSYSLPMVKPYFLHHINLNFSCFNKAYSSIIPIAITMLPKQLCCFFCISYTFLIIFYLRS